MLQGKIIAMALSVSDQTISPDRSRCVRMRYNKNTCSLCIDTCRTGAISIYSGIVIDAGKCTACLLCLSVCPSGCFAAAEEDYSVLLSKLRKLQNTVSHPVLGCRQARDTEAHEKTGCMGFLSEEHLIALAESLDKPLYVNLTACGGCRNSFIVERLKSRIQSARTKTIFDIGKKIILAEKKTALVFEDVPLDRRGFFQALKTMGITQVAGMIEKGNAEMPVSYTEKKLPLKRALLNAVVRKHADGNAIADLFRNYAYTMKAGSSCANCFACIGMCPTGALKIRKNGTSQELLFNSSLCTGCGLCGDFCPHHAASVSLGFFGNNYFEHDICNAAAITAHGVAGEN